MTVKQWMREFKAIPKHGITKEDAEKCLRQLRKLLGIK